ncbi:MAG: discoidin domain-containing protein [Clostridia bacterium]|nr:discoidin domain-containing protein [Clostridia bacterium]
MRSTKKTIKMSFKAVTAALLTAAVLLAAVPLTVLFGSVGAKAAALSMVREALELYVGEEDKLELKGEGSANATWKSSDESVVTVDKDGAVKGLKVGTAEITATSGAAEAVCKVYVVEKEYSFDDDIMISIFWPPTSDYINDEQYKYMADAGITWVMGAGDNLGSKKDQKKMLELCYKYGIHMTVGDSRLGGNLTSMSASSIKKVLDEYRNLPAANGYYMLDEPYNPNGFILAYKALKDLDPNSYMHLNFLPYNAYSSAEVYEAQMADWVRLCEQAGYVQDYLMYDKYPFGLSAGSMDRTGFLINLDSVRRVGLENGVKTGTYIQSVCQEVAFRSPNEAETRYEVNMALAFGVKQLSYFTWFTPYNRSEPFIDGIIHWDGTPNPKYEFICRINAEVHNLGPTLAKCDSLEVYMGKNRYDAIELIPDDFFVKLAEKRDVTVAYLRNRENGRNYLMVVNNNFSKATKFTLDFEDAIKSLEYVSEQDGKIYKQEMDGYGRVSMELAAGAARLFVLPEGYDFSARRQWVPAANENLALHARVLCNSSQGSAGWYMTALNDGRRFSADGMNGWSPYAGLESAIAVLDFGQEVEFNRVDIYPAGSIYEYGLKMPGGFVLAASEDGENWYKLAEAENFKVEKNTAPSIKFDTVKARYLRIIASDFTGGEMEICEVEVYKDDGGIPETEIITAVKTQPRGENVVKYTAGKSVSKGKSVIVSTYPAGQDYKSWGWWPDYLTDGDLKRGWTSNVKIHMDDENSTEFAIVDLGDYFNIDKIEVSPNGCWPKDFEILLSDDMQNWETLASETNSSAPKKTYDVEVGGAKHGRYVMLKATKLRRTDADGYMLQLGEINVTGTPWKNAEEAEQFIKEYTDAGGNAESATVKEVRSILADASATQSQLDAAMLKMLAEVGKTLPQAGDNVERAVYKFTVVEDPMGTKQTDETPVPTMVPDGGDDEKDAEKTGTGKILLIAGIALAVVLVAAAVVAAVVVSRKKKKDATLTND